MDRNTYMAPGISSWCIRGQRPFRNHFRRSTSHQTCGCMYCLLIFCDVKRRILFLAGRLRLLPGANGGSRGLPFDRLKSLKLQLSEAHPPPDHAVRAGARIAANAFLWAWRGKGSILPFTPLSLDPPQTCTDLCRRARPNSRTHVNAGPVHGLRLSILQLDRTTHRGRLRLRTVTGVSGARLFLFRG